MRRLCTLVAATVLAVIALHAGTARAQTDSFVSVGLSGRLNEPSGKGLDGVAAFTPLIRVRRSAGWKPDLRLDWFSVETADGARVRLRPIMAGMGYTWERRRLTLTASATAGYAFCGLGQRPLTAPEYQVSNSLTAGSSLTGWYDLTRRVGLRASLGYVVVRPELALSGAAPYRLKADSVLAKVGLTYGVF